jgi:hypothetical protein
MSEEEAHHKGHKGHKVQQPVEHNDGLLDAPSIFAPFVFFVVGSFLLLDEG